ncbi:hypothetical protein ABFT23_14415 [Nocardioides sp. C4-1]|uniref:hypothetical protein n=1 Tax=Nocardioides sp. C4-1 TaxID=3151851 RepID=UPI003263320B
MEVPATMKRVVRLVWALVLLAGVMTVLAVVLDDQILDAAGTPANNPDDTRVPPSYSPVVVVLYVTLAALVLVLLAFVRNAHNWARHCLAVTFVLLALAMVALLVAGPPVTFVPFVCVWLALDAALLHQLYRPESGAFLAPRERVAG